MVPLVSSSLTRHVVFVFADSSPSVGDTVNSTLAVVLIYKFKRLGLGIPRSVYRKMVARIIISSVIGLIPVAGAFFSRLYRCNKKNSSAIQSCFVHHRDESGEPKVLRRNFFSRRAI